MAAEKTISPEKEELICHHCGLPALETIQHDDHFYCCQGCLSASIFLMEESCPLPNNQFEPDLNWTELKGALSAFEEGRMGSAVLLRFRLPGIHCAACIQVLEKLHLRNQGIVYSEVFFLSKEILLAYEPAITKASAVIRLLGSLGYPPDLSPGFRDEHKSREKKSDLLLMRLALAAFCSGNIMLFSFPEYLGLEEESYSRIFSFLNLALALPAVIFSGQPWWNSVLQAIRNRELNLDVPIAVGMLATFSLSLYEILAGSGTGYFDSLTGLIFFLLAGRWIQDQAFRQLSFERDYKSYFPLSVIRWKNNSETPVLSTDIISDDVLRIRHAEIIPCDGILVENEAEIDTSFINGESIPLLKKKGDYISAGTRLLSSTALLKAVHSMERSRLVRLWNNPVFEKKKGPESLQSFSRDVARYFTPAVLLLALLTGIGWYFHASENALKAFVSVLIVACPCTLALAYPIAMGNTMRRWGQRGFFIKNDAVVETLGRADTLVFDKTGTLGDRIFKEIRYEGEELNADEKKGIAALAACSIHPLSLAISNWLNSRSQEGISSFTEIPGKGISGIFQDHKIQLGSAEYVGKAQNNSGQTEVMAAINGKIMGSFFFSSRQKPFVKNMLNRLKSVYRLALISGDKENPAENWSEIFENVGGISLFRQSPQDKLRILEDMKNKNFITVMIGDGLNDAGALKAANCGIALAADAHQFTPGSDAIMLESALSDFPEILKEAKRSIRVVKLCFIVSLVYNAGGFLLAAGGMLSPLLAALLMPASSFTVAGIAWLGTSGRLINSTQKK